jgi:hypothetical protein
MRQGWLLYGNGGPFTAEDDPASLLKKFRGFDLIRAKMKVMISFAHCPLGADIASEDGLVSLHLCTGNSISLFTNASFGLTNYNHLKPQTPMHR